VKAWGTREEDEWRVKNRFYMNRERERPFFMNGLIMIHPKCLLKKEKETIDDGEASSNLVFHTLTQNEEPFRRVATMMVMMMMRGMDDFFPNGISHQSHKEKSCR